LQKEKMENYRKKRYNGKEWQKWAGVYLTLTG
jgi:hypothetical protein